MSSSPARQTTTASFPHHCAQRKAAGPPPRGSPTDLRPFATPAISPPGVGWISNRRILPPPQTQRKPRPIHAWSPSRVARSRAPPSMSRPHVEGGLDRRRRPRRSPALTRPFLRRRSRTAGGPPACRPPARGPGVIADAGVTRGPRDRRTRRKPGGRAVSGLGLAIQLVPVTRSNARRAAATAVGVRDRPGRPARPAPPSSARRSGRPGARGRSPAGAPGGSVTGGCP